MECYQSGGCSVYWYDIPSQVVTGPPEEVCIELKYIYKFIVVYECQPLGSIL